VIIMRGVDDPHRVTVRWNDRNWRCDDVSHGWFYVRGSDPRRPGFCHDHARGRVERTNRAVHRQFAALFGIDSDSGASTEALAMLDRRRPFTRADVQNAFRAESLKGHPDHGGDPDFFRALVHARDAALADADPD
jgi:hypothetical protein